jgi:hypothetical protein
MDLEGPFTTTSLGAGVGTSLTFEQFGGLGTEKQAVTGAGLTFGVGLGVGGGMNQGPTHVGPAVNLLD